MKLTTILILFSLAASGQVIETYRDGSVVFKHGNDTLFGITKEQVYKVREMQLRKDSIQNENEILSKQVSNLRTRLDTTQSIVIIEKERSKLIYEDLQTKKIEAQMWEDNAKNKNNKLKINRKGFAITSGLIIVRLGIRLGLGI